jgi:putative transcriptional regulator
MTILHHPSESLLTAFSAGILDLGQHVAIATHALSCADCRKWTRTVERLGGVTLENLPPAAMPGDALNSVLSRLDEPVKTAKQRSPASASALAEVPGLPKFVRRYPAGEWKWIAPRLHLRPIHVPDAGDTRVFLLKAGPSLKLLPHAHTGTEMTCVLTGSFNHDGSRFGAGDFDLGDSDVDHEISIGPECECLCLVAMQGELRLKGLLGNLMQPFVSI